MSARDIASSDQARKRARRLITGAACNQLECWFCAYVTVSSSYGRCLFVCSFGCSTFFFSFFFLLVGVLVQHFTALLGAPGNFSACLACHTLVVHRLSTSKDDDNLLMYSDGDIVFLAGQAFSMNNSARPPPRYDVWNMRSFEHRSKRKKRFCRFG